MDMFGQLNDKPVSLLTRNIYTYCDILVLSDFGSFAIYIQVF